MSLIYNLAKLSLEQNNLIKLTKIKIEDLSIDEEIIYQILSSKDTISKDPYVQEKISFPKISKKTELETEPTWIFDKFINEKKCTSCYNKNVNNLKTGKQKIIDNINSNYHNYLNSRSKYINKNLQYDFTDNEND